MARGEPMPQFQHSLWDRLTDATLRLGPDMVRTFAGEAERIKQEVRRDLEWLLNTRCSYSAVSSDQEALDRSLLRFGLPDLSSLNVSDPKERERLRGVLAAIIRDFEPRLDHVEVWLVEELKTNGRPSLHYRIEAVLKLRPSPLSVAFDTVLELGTKTFRVEG